MHTKVYATSFMGLHHLHLAWRRVFLLLSQVRVHQGYFTWGIVSCLYSCLGPHSFFEGEDIDLIFMLLGFCYSQRSLYMIVLITRQGDPQRRNGVFTRMASITLKMLTCSWRLASIHRRDTFNRGDTFRDQVEDSHAPQLVELFNKPL